MRRIRQSKAEREREGQREMYIKLGKSIGARRVVVYGSQKNRIFIGRLGYNWNFDKSLGQYIGEK